MKGVEKEEEEEEKGGGMMTMVVVHNGLCTICLDSIELQETALVKGCEHAYCVNCILQWATLHEHPKCPQCKQPFESLSIHRALNGRWHIEMPAIVAATIKILFDAALGMAMF